MLYRTVAMCGLVLLIAPLFSGLPGLAAAESADKLPPEAMAGEIVDPSGKPAAGATVWLVGGPYDEDAKTLEKTVTDAEGRFVFPQAKSKWDASQARQPHLVARDAQGRFGGEQVPWAWGSPEWTPRQDLRIGLVDVRDYRGRVVDGDGKPIAQATIRPRSINPDLMDTAGHRGFELPPELADELSGTTGADGAFALPRAPAGGSLSSRVMASGFGSPLVEWNLDAPVALRLDRAGGVRGRLVAPGGAAGLDAMKLYFYVGADRDNKKDFPFRVSYSNEGQPDKEGRFAFDGVPPGSGHLSVSLYESDLPYYVEKPIPVVVKPGETTSIEVPLLPAVAVRGQVVDAQTEKGIAGVTLCAFRISEEGHAMPSRRTKTDAEGRFAVYIQPGKVGIEIYEVPEGHVAPSREGESPKMDATKDITWPTIKLQRAARLEAIVVDPAGQPVADAEVQFLVPRNHRLVITERTDAQGVCSLGQLNPKEFLAVRARSDSAVSDVIQIRPMEAKGPVRLALSPNNVFTIRGACVDAAGRPIRGAKVSIYTIWMLGPSGLGVSVASPRTDAEGRFEARALWPGFRYHVSIAAEGYDKFESESFRSQPGEVHDVSRLALVATGGFVEGVVTDTAGKPIAEVRVFNSGDAPKTLSTKTDAAGRFRLDGFRMGPVFVFAERDGYRFAAAQTQSQDTGVKIVLLRKDEPRAPWKPQRPPLTLEDGQHTARRILEKFWATPPHGRKERTIQYMARIDPQTALAWSAELGGRYDSLVHRIAAEQSDAADVDETLALLAKQGNRSAYFTLQTLAERLAASDPEKALRLAEEMIQRARRIDQPERIWALAACGTLVAKLGSAEAGRKLAEEAAGMAEKLGVEGRQDYIRGLAATALAPYDLPRATRLVEPVPEGHERERALARIATAIASKDLDKALEIIGKLDKRSTLPDNARMRIAYELVPTRRDDALRVVEQMNTHGAAKTKAEALGWMAVAVAPRDPAFAHSLIDKSMAIYWDQPEEFRGWSYFGGGAAFAAFLVAQANEVGYPDVGGLIDRVLAMRPSGDDGWSPRSSQEGLILTAAALALVDRERARQVLLRATPRPPGTEDAAAVLENRELLQAWTLIDPEYVATLVEARMDAAKGGDFWTNYLISAIDLLVAPPDERPKLLFRYTGGRWFPDEEI